MQYRSSSLTNFMLIFHRRVKIIYFENYQQFYDFFCHRNERHLVHPTEPIQLTLSLAQHIPLCEEQVLPMTYEEKHTLECNNVR